MVEDSKLQGIFRGRHLAAVCLFFWALVPSLAAQEPKPDAAVAPLAAIGDVSDAQKRVLFNTLESLLSASYAIISQEEYAAAEELAFESLEAEACTEEQCIRAIQDFLQVERLFVLQIVREADFTQLSLTLARAADKIVREDTCIGCDIAGLYGKLRDLVAEVVAADGLAAAAPTAGRVFVSSAPTGAEIILDGEVLPGRVTDVLLENISPGPHTFTLRKGNPSGSQTVELAAGGIARVELFLTEAQAVLQIGTTPFNAAVIVDGRVKGKTPMALELPPGEYELRLELEGHVPVARPVVLTLDQPTRVDAILQPGGTLEFEGLSGETRITLDGAPAVPDGDALFIAAGPHQVELTREGYFPRLEPVIVVAGETVTLDASMEPTLSTRQAMAAGAHDAWVWKWGLSYGVAAVAGILMLQDVQSLLASND